MRVLWHENEGSEREVESRPGLLDRLAEPSTHPVRAQKTMASIARKREFMSLSRLIAGVTTRIALSVIHESESRSQAWDVQAVCIGVGTPLISTGFSPRPRASNGVAVEDRSDPPAGGPWIVRLLPPAASEQWGGCGGAQRPHGRRAFDRQALPRPRASNGVAVEERSDPTAGGPSIVVGVRFASGARTSERGPERFFRPRAPGPGPFRADGIRTERRRESAPSAHPAPSIRRAWPGPCRRQACKPAGCSRRSAILQASSPPCLRGWSLPTSARRPDTRRPACGRSPR